MSDITVEAVQKNFGSLQVIGRMDLKIRSGEFISILGRSGCGKSTLLRLIAGLESPTQGSIFLSPASKISYVFQDPHLLPWLTVEKNIALPLQLAKTSLTEIQESVRRALTMIGLEDFSSAYPNQLSGGMRMRVSLARALVTRPTLLLLDEPFAALDEITRQKLDEDLRVLWMKNKMTIIFVTHSTQEAAFLSDRAIVFSKRPGRIVLDRKMNLPTDRKLEIKTSPAYFEEVAKLFHSLEGESP
jgi:NitT/TauT family transport system ATP-binding protein